MDLYQAVSTRHSYRGEFARTPVPRETLRRIVQAGIEAPSGKNRQTTTFVIIDDPVVLKKMTDCIGTTIHLSTAQAAIVVVMDSDDHGDPDFYFGVQDYSAAVENLLLAITAESLATVWIEGQLLSGADDQIAEVVGVADPLKVMVVLPLGFPVKPGTQREKKPFGERAWFNSYGVGDE